MTWVFSHKGMSIGLSKTLPVKTIKLFLLFFLLGWPAVAQETTPVGLVTAFYNDYQSQAGNVRRLLPTQSQRLDSQLFSRLSEMAGYTPRKPGPNGAWLDFDPFINAQMNAATIRCGDAETRDSLSYVPVYVSLRSPGHEQLQVHAVVSSEKGTLKIMNFVYPAREGRPAWDLDGWMISKLQR